MARAGGVQLVSPPSDLGQIYYNNYLMPAAWTCWDAARRLYPKHTMLQEITELEWRFEHDFPEFF